jgi:hypothetical protein
MTDEQAREKWAAMSHEERLAMARTAPRVARSWKENRDWWEREHDGDSSAGYVIGGGAFLGGLRAYTWLCEEERVFNTNQVDEAKAWVDEQLIKEGWVLE